MSAVHPPSDSRDHRSGRVVEPAGAGSRSTGTSGYGAAIVVNVVMLVLINVWPGWQVVPFLTDPTALVIPLVNASLVVAVVANLVYLVADPPRLRALGDLVVTCVGIAALIRLWQVFPFDVLGTPWEMVLRVLLGLGLLGSAVSAVVALARLVRGAPARV